MAMCFFITPNKAFSGTTSTKVNTAVAGATVGNAAMPLESMPYRGVDAGYVDGQYSCGAGLHLMLTAPEMNALAHSPYVAGPEHYQAVSIIFGAAITALAVIWGVKRVLKVFNTHTES